MSQPTRKCGGCGSGPSLLRKAVNFTRAATKHVRQGRPKVSLEVIQERFEICRNCPSGLFVEIDKANGPKSLRKLDSLLGTCKHPDCGCYLHSTETFPNKLAWNSTTCPHGHWEPVADEPNG